MCIRDRVDCVEVFGQVYVYYVFVALFVVAFGLFQRLVRAFHGPESVAVGVEAVVYVVLDDLDYCLLYTSRCV